MPRMPLPGVSPLAVRSSQRAQGSTARSRAIGPGPAQGVGPALSPYSSDLNFGVVQLPHTHGKVQSATLPLSSAR